MRYVDIINKRRKSNKLLVIVFRVQYAIPYSTQASKAR